MHVRFTQIVDRWIGVPLCALCRLFDRLIQLFPRPSRQTSDKVLFIELSEMGSAFLAYPAMQEVLRQGTDPTDIYFLIFKSNAESVALLDCIPNENILTIADSSFPRFLFSTLRCIQELRSLHFSLVFDLELFSRFTSLVSYFSAAPKRVGFSNFTEEGLYRGDLLTHPVWYNPFVHISQNFLHLVHAGLKPTTEIPAPKIPVAAFPEGQVPPFTPSAELSDRLRTELDVKLSASTRQCRLLVVNPDPGQLPLRGWPIENYAAVLTRLEKDFPDLCVIVCGMKSSQVFAERLRALAPIKRFINFCGATANLRELTELLAMADAFISSDSGPGHLVTLTDTPALILFGPETPGRYRPLGVNIRVEYTHLACSPCYTAANHRHSACTRNECMLQISTDSVYTTVKTFLKA